MKKILALIVVLILGMASVSIVTSLDPCSEECYNASPTQSQECFTNCCEEFCSEYPESPICGHCSAYAFFEYNLKWFDPYWMEIYGNEVKGCYARDLVCLNSYKLVEIQRLSCEERCSIQCGQDSECYNGCMEDCERRDCFRYLEEARPVQVYMGNYNGRLTLDVPSCTDSRTFFSKPPPCGLEGDFSAYDSEKECCFDMRKCGNTPSLECATSCRGYEIPSNYRCDVNEYVIMFLDMGVNGGSILINGIQYNVCPHDQPIGEETPSPGCVSMIVWYNGKRPFDSVPGIIVNQGVPRTITIEGEGTLEFELEQKCCYDCTPKPPLPATLLYPKVDIEQLSVAGGPTVIQDGKVIASLTTSPGTQQAMIQVENRGFFTQRDARVRFEGLDRKSVV